MFRKTTPSVLISILSIEKEELQVMEYCLLLGQYNIPILFKTHKPTTITNFNYINIFFIDKIYVMKFHHNK